MREYPLRLVEALIAKRCTLASSEDFIEHRTDLLEEVGSALWLLAWTETSRENRRQRVAELIGGRRQFAGRLSANGRVDRSWADEAVAGTNQLGLAIGA